MKGIQLCQNLNKNNPKKKRKEKRKTDDILVFAKLPANVPEKNVLICPNYGWENAETFSIPVALEITNLAFSVAASTSNTTI